MTTPAPTLYAPNPSSSSETKPLPANARGWSKEKARNETALHLACELLNNALTGNFSNLQYELIRVTEAGLLDSLDYMVGAAEGLVANMEKIECTIRDVFPQCSRGPASKMLSANISFQDQIELYRAETFWTNRDPKVREVSEKLISEIWACYEVVDRMIREIDHECEECRFPDWKGAPVLHPNLYPSVS